MRFPLILLLAVLAFSQPAMEALSGISCPAGEFRGIGVAKTETDAIAHARSMIASQIKSSISYKSESKTDMKVKDGVEHLNTSNTMQSEQKSSLLNAQDAHIRKSLAQNGYFGVVACMSRENAAKPYAARQAQTVDSLSMIAQTFPSLASPKQKKETWQKASRLYNEHLENGRVLQSLGKSQSENLEAFNFYQSVKSGYQSFCSGQKIYWQKAEGYGSNMLYSKFSGDFVLSSGECDESGLKISVLNTDIQCEYKSMLGNHLCMFKPTLKGESCAGETFFQLPLNPALSMSSKVSRSAEAKLESTIRTTDFTQWKQELKKWTSACAD
ncbi:MAG: LPP20 family lipoprotein [Fibromonadales bacterium]|nr:LPP20 family lipoprotein [Fibromonadales bacterium]